MKKAILLMTIVLLGACSATSADHQPDLMVSVASSLSGAMSAIETEFHNRHPEINVRFNYGSSGKLRNQIQQGAPADVFLSASAEDMNLLLKESFVAKDTIVNFAENRLVLVSAKTIGETDLRQALENATSRIAIGEPASVPVGTFTKNALLDLDLWDIIEDQLIFAKDAKQVLSYVESGNAEMGFVYLSDARVSQKVETLIDVPMSGQEVFYPAGILEKTDNRQAAEYFISFLLSEDGQQLLEDYGFANVEGET